MDNGEFEHVPGNVRTLIEAIGLLQDEDFNDEEIAGIYRPIRLGLCMTCGSELGEHVILLVSTKGIMGAYCGGPCLQDQAVLGWIQEQHDDIISAVKFRGNTDADEPESD